MKRAELSADKVTLALNAAEGRLQVVVFNEAKARNGDSSLRLPVILSAHEWSGQSRGVEVLAAGIRSALDILRLDVGLVGKIACVRGPGNFTGLRLCIATAQGLARGTGAQIGGIEYLALLARSAFLRIFGLPGLAGENAEDGSGSSAKIDPTPTASVCWVVTHARSNLVHIQGFELAFGQSVLDRHIGRLCEIMVLPPERAADLICDYSAGSHVSPIVVGSGLAKNEDVWRQRLRQLPDGARLYLETHDAPSPLAIALESDCTDYGAGDLAPLYARASDAEENIAGIAVGLGLDPVAARKRLKTLACYEQ